MTGGSNEVVCRVCGGGLPPGAMFCGECGSPARHPGWMDASRERAASRTEAREYERLSALVRQTPVSVAAPSPVAVERARPMPAPDTETTVRTGDRPPAPEQEPVGRPVLELRPEAREPQDEPEIGPGLWPDAEPEPEPEPAWLSEPDPQRPEPQPEPEQSEPERPEPERPDPERPESQPKRDERVARGEPVAATGPDLAPAHLADDRADRADRTGAAEADDNPAPPGEITAPRQAVCGSLVARFSTGETVTLHGTGLLGRNPVPSEGERFDVLVRISDPGRSVSKTHLEFVVDAGRLWIRDRYSGNGTILRHPNGTGSRCEAGRRYRVQDGDRVEIGEQFFVIR